MLTEQELNQIRAEAERYIIQLQASSASIDPTRDRNRRKGYIAAATLYQERAKPVLEALQELVYLKSIKDIPEYKEEYEARKQKAWAAAKKAVVSPITMNH